jgi:hypothetical protein
MAIPDDILISITTDPAAGRPKQSRMIAFVPITVALIGVAIVLVGGVSARNYEAAARAIDLIMTGSVEAAPPPAAAPELR